MFSFKIKEFSWLSCFFIVVLTYLVSHGLMLFIYGAWWDDSAIWNASEEAIKNHWGNGEYPFIYYLYKNISGVTDLQTMNLLYRCIPFFCWLISLMCFFVFLKKVSGHKSFTFISSLIAASCSLNKCMVLISCYHYTISISLFMLGLVLFVYDYYKNNPILIFLVSILWTLSLIIWRSAVLVIPFILVFSVLYNKKIDLKSKSFYIMFIKDIIRHYGVIIMGLVIFALLYKTILAPKGVYEDYYSVRIMNLILSPITTSISSISLILGYLSDITSVFSHGTTSIVVVLFMSIFLLLLFFRFSQNYNESKLGRNQLLFSCLFLFFSIMPHLLIEGNFLFGINGYKSRAASLAIYPISMIIAFMMIKTLNGRKRVAFCSSFIILSIFSSMHTYLDYEKGWMKNEAIAYFFKNNVNLEGNNIVCIDNSELYSPFRNEEYRYYDYECCAKYAYGRNDQTKCSGLDALKSYQRFDRIDYYLSINVKEQYSHVGLKSIFFRIQKSSKRDDMIKNMLMFRLETKEEFATANL